MANCDCGCDCGVMYASNQPPLHPTPPRSTSLQYFRHGAVSSAKTLNLLAVSHNYKSQGKQVLLLKPSVGS